MATRNNKKQDTKKKNPITKKFEEISDKVSNVVGSPYWFIFSLLIILIWLPSGFFIGFNELWHLHINTFTTIFTFLMMALLHTSQRKWEEKMERYQQREGSDIKGLKEETEELADKIPTTKKS